MENTASETTTAWRRDRVRSPSARRSRSRWGYTHAWARAARMPSMIDAWLSSSLNTTVSWRPPAPTSAPSTPRLAAKPVGNTSADPVPFHAARAASSSWCTGRLPDDQARGTGARAVGVQGVVGRRHHVRVLAEAQVVVGGEVHHGAAVLQPGAHRAVGQAAHRTPPPGVGDGAVAGPDRVAERSHQDAHVLDGGRPACPRSGPPRRRWWSGAARPRPRRPAVGSARRGPRSRRSPAGPSAGRRPVGPAPRRS